MHSTKPQSRSASIRADLTRQGSSLVSSQSHKLEVSFLLNKPENASSNGGSGTGRSNSSRREKPRGSTQKRYNCEFCPATFAQSHDALKHKRTVHEKLRPYMCDTCGKSFGEKGNLSKHKKSVHLNERPFKCEFCSSSFAFKDGLHRHRSLVHLDQRPFVCETCGADFKQISQLRKHTCAHLRVR